MTTPPDSPGTLPDYRCPGCNTVSRLVIARRQAFCTSEDGCNVLTFDPGLPDGGLS